MAVADLTFQEEVAAPQEDSQFVMVWRRFRRHRLALHLARQHQCLIARRVHQVVVRCAVLSAEHAARTVAQAVAGNVGDRRLAGFDPHLEIATGAADVLTVAAGIGTEFMADKEQRKTCLGHFHRAELQAAGRMPLTGIVPAIAARRSPAAGPRMK